MQDRFTEFLSGVKQSGASPTPKRVMFETPLKDIELGFIRRSKEYSGANPDLDTMEGFHTGAQAVSSSLATMRNNVVQVQVLYIKAIGSTTTEKADKMSSQLETLLSVNTTIAKDIKQRLDLMRVSTQNIQSSPTPLPPADLKIRLNLHSSLCQKFQDLIKEYQDLQTNYKDKYEEKIKRQYKITRPDATEQEVELALAQDDPGKIFAQESVQSQVQAAQDAVVYIKERQKDIKRLEKSIRELHQVFTDMSILVDNQGEMLNQIEYNVTASEVYIEQGNQELSKALMRKRRHRKLMIVLTIVVLVLVAVIVVPIVTTIPRSIPH